MATNSEAPLGVLQQGFTKSPFYKYERSDKALLTHTAQTKGQLARVCLNIDISKPFRGSLNVSNGNQTILIPLIYGGLCALRNSEVHALEAWP